MLLQRRHRDYVRQQSHKAVAGGASRNERKKEGREGQIEEEEERDRESGESGF